MVEKTVLESSQIRAILSFFDVGVLESFELITKGDCHTNYQVRTSQSTYILRVYEERTNQEITLEHALLTKLADTSVPAPKLLASTNQEEIVTFGDLRISMFTHLDGVHVNEKQATNNQFRSVGQHLGLLHVSLNGFHPPEVDVKMEYNTKWTNKILLDVQEDNPGFPQEYAQFCQGILDTITLTEVPRGFNHADFHSDNLLFIEDEVSAVLDFDDCFYGDLLSDIAGTLMFWCMDEEIHFEKCRLLLEGYQEHRQLTDAEKHALYERLLHRTLIHLIYIWWTPNNWSWDVKPVRVIKALEDQGEETLYKNFF